MKILWHNTMSALGKNKKRTWKTVSMYYQQSALSHPEEWNNIVLGNRLQKSRSPRQGLQARSNCREEWANDNNPRWRPGERSHHQVFSYSIPEPASKCWLNETFTITSCLISIVGFQYTREVYTTAINRSVTQMNSLISEDHSFNAGAKQDHRS